MDLPKYPFSRLDRQPSEPTFHELRLVSAISANSPYHLFQALNSLAIAISGQPFTPSQSDMLRSALYPFLSDIAAGRDRILPVFLPTDTGFLKVKVESASTTPTVSLELASRSFWSFLVSRILITGLSVPLIFIAQPQYSFTPTSCPASGATPSPVDSFPVHNVISSTFTDLEWEAVLATGPTLLEQLAARAIHAGSAHGLHAVLQHIALGLLPNCSPVDNLDGSLECLTGRIQAIHHALSTKTNTNFSIDLPGCDTYLDLCCFTLGDTPHIRLSVRTLPYLNSVGYSWADTLSELPVPLPCLPDGTLAPIPPELHVRAPLIITDTRLPLSTKHAMQLLVLTEDESFLRLAINEATAYHRHAPHSTYTELIQTLFGAIVLTIINVER